MEVGLILASKLSYGKDLTKSSPETLTSRLLMCALVLLNFLRWDSRYLFTLTRRLPPFVTPTASRS